MEIEDKPTSIEFDNLPFDIITEILLYLNTEDLFQSAFVSRNIRKCVLSSPILKLVNIKIILNIDIFTVFNITKINTSFCREIDFLTQHCSM